MQALFAAMFQFRVGYLRLKCGGLLGAVLSTAAEKANDSQKIDRSISLRRSALKVGIP